MRFYFCNKSGVKSTARWVAGIALLLSSAFAWSADSASPLGPGDVVGKVTTNIMTLVREAPAYFDDDPDRYINAVGAELDSVVDFRSFARGVMGDYASSARYRAMTEEQRERLREQLNRFTTVLRDGIVNTYSRGLLAFGSSRVELGETEISPGSTRVASVNQYVYAEDGKTYTVKYQMGQYKDGSWRLRNLIIENINLGEIYRGQFAAAADSAEGNLDLVIDTWDDSQIRARAEEG
jgi:phospholipid transport system substrate-binding protein